MDEICSKPRSFIPQPKVVVNPRLRVFSQKQSPPAVPPRKSVSTPKPPSITKRKSDASMVSIKKSKESLKAPRSPVTSRMQQTPPNSPPSPKTKEGIKGPLAQRPVRGIVRSSAPPRSKMNNEVARTRKLPLSPEIKKNKQSGKTPSPPVSPTMSQIKEMVKTNVATPKLRKSKQDVNVAHFHPINRQKSTDVLKSPVPTRLPSIRKNKFTSQINAPADQGQTSQAMSFPAAKASNSSIAKKRSHTSLVGKDTVYSEEHRLLNKKKTDAMFERVMKEVEKMENTYDFSCLEPPPDLAELSPIPSQTNINDGLVINLGSTDVDELLAALSPFPSRTDLSEEKSQCDPSIEKTDEAVKKVKPLPSLKVQNYTIEHTLVEHLMEFDKKNVEQEKIIRKQIEKLVEERNYWRSVEQEIKERRKALMNIDTSDKAFCSASSLHSIINSKQKTCPLFKNDEQRNTTEDNEVKNVESGASSSVGENKKKVESETKNKSGGFLRWFLPGAVFTAFAFVYTRFSSSGTAKPA